MENNLEPPMEITDEFVTAAGTPSYYISHSNEANYRDCPFVESSSLNGVGEVTEQMPEKCSNDPQADEESEFVGRSASRKRLLSDDEDEEDGTLCPICFSSWSNTGDHRICSLKCGHLFGYKCLKRWSENKRNCPTCKKKFNKSDVRYIYANKLIAVDTSEVEAVQKQLNMVIEEKNRTALDLARSLTKEQVLNHEIATLKRRLYDVTSKSHSTSSQATFNGLSGARVRLFMDKSLEVCKHAGCRVLGISCSLDLLVASIKSPNNLFSGYGLKKMNISSYKPLSFIAVHSQPIRDVCFHPEQMCVLSVGMDKAAKIIDLTCNSVVSSVSCQMPLWSCCWDADNNYYYCGTQSGTVFKFDKRHSAEPVAALSVPGDMSPVVSVASVPKQPGSHSVNGAIISCKLNSLWLFENNEEYTRHNLPLEGPFVSMKYQQQGNQMLVSARPNNRFPYSRHTVCTLEKNNAQVNCNVLHCFPGGGMQKLLSKSTFITNNNDYVAAYQESDKRVYLWSLNTGEKVASVPAHDVVLDLGGVENNLGNYLVSLTEKKLEFFKFH